MTGSPKRNDGVLISRPCDGKQGEGHVTTKAEIRMMCLKARNARDCWQCPEARTRQEGAFPGGFMESVAYPCLDFRLWPPEL